MLLIKFRVQGHSMMPTIQNGSEILVSSIPYLFSRPKIGDIIAFNKEQKILVKRITKIKSGQFFVAGDNSKDSLDGWINKKYVLGKLIKKWF